LTQLRIVTPTFSVSPQIAPEDIDAIKAAGFGLIINNRPDGESPDQPAGFDIEAAARAQGLDYAHVPIVGRPTAEQADAVCRLLAAAEGKSLAYCRSGNRSITAWALGELTAGARGREELLRLTAAAGYDLASVLPG
jgi:uncharacterized protein (TIGR01244 family)